MVATIFTCGEQEIPLKHSPNPRAKRLSLRMSSQENALVLTIPPLTSIAQINRFLKQCIPWVEKQLQKITDTPSIKPGEEIPLHGIIYQCVLDPLRRKPALCKVTNTLRLPPRCLQEDLYAFFKKMAEKTLPSYVLEAVQMLGERVEKITLRDSKTRWGSCSGRKTISLSWRLILAPPEVARYVCIHEAVHLVHMNHSPDFWKAVESLCPAYRTHKKWLKVNGPALMHL